MRRSGAAAIAGNSVALVGNSLVVQRLSGGEWVNVSGQEQVAPRETVRFLLTAGGIRLFTGSVTFKVWGPPGKDAGGPLIFERNAGFGLFSESAAVQSTAPTVPGLYQVEAKTGDGLNPFGSETDSADLLVKEGAPPPSAPGPGNGVLDRIGFGGIGELFGDLGTIAKMGVLVVGGVIVIKAIDMTKK